MEQNEYIIKDAVGEIARVYTATYGGVETVSSVSPLVGFKWLIGKVWHNTTDWFTRRNYKIEATNDLHRDRLSTPPDSGRG
jgi:hypothetical protein